MGKESEKAAEPQKKLRSLISSGAHPTKFNCQIKTTKIEP